MELRLPCLDHCRAAERSVYALVSSNSDDEGGTDKFYNSPIRRHKKEDDVLAEIPGMLEIRSDGSQYRNQHVWESVVQHKSEMEDKEAEPVCCGVKLDCTALDDPEKEPKIVRFGSQLECALFWGMRLLALFDLVYVPFVASFDYVYPLRSGIARPLADMVLTALYALGVALRLQTSIVRHEDVEEVMSLAKIRGTVLRSSTFRMDLVALLAMPLLYAEFPVGWLCAFRLLKCWRLRPDPQRSMLLNSEESFYVQVGEIIAAMFICIHLYACAWFVAKIHSPLGMGREWSAWNGWSRDVFEKPMADYGGLSVPIEPGDLHDLMYCWARAARDGVYMITSWGGPNALCLNELVVIIFLGPMSGVIMAYVYAIFVTTVTRKIQFEVKFHERSASIEACCRQMHLPEDLRFRINRYYSYVALHHHDHNTLELFSELSPNLRDESRLFRMRDIICESELFQTLTSTLILPLLSGCVESVFSPGDIIVRKGEIADCVYIILRGSASVLPELNAQTPVARLKERQMFGEICFYTGKNPRTAFVRSEVFSVVSQLEKDHFDAVLADYPEVKQAVLDSIIRKVRNYRRETISMLSEDLVNSVQKQGSRRPSIIATRESPRREETETSTQVPSSLCSAGRLTRTRFILEEVQKNLIAEYEENQAKKGEDPDSDSSSTSSETTSKDSKSRKGSKESSGKARSGSKDSASKVDSKGDSESPSNARRVSKEPKESSKESMGYKRLSRQSSREMCRQISAALSSSPTSSANLKKEVRLSLSPASSTAPVPGSNYQSETDSQTAGWIGTGAGSLDSGLVRSTYTSAAVDIQQERVKEPDHKLHELQTSLQARVDTLAAENDALQAELCAMKTKEASKEDPSAQSVKLVPEQQAGRSATPLWAADVQPLQTGLREQERAMAVLQGQVNTLSLQLSRMEETQHHIASALGVFQTHRQPTPPIHIHEGSEPVQAPGG